MPVDVNESILASVKKVLGIADSYTAFDLDITMYINSAFSNLLQIADIGGPDGFEIENRESKWDSVIANKKHLNSAKTFVIQSVRLAFDPPTTSFAIEAIKKQIEEAGWRLSLYAPSANYTKESTDA